MSTPESGHRPSQPAPPAAGSTPRPAPPGAGGGRELADALHRLDEVDPQDLDAVVSAAEDAHRQLRNRLGHAGGA